MNTKVLIPVLAVGAIAIIGGIFLLTQTSVPAPNGGTTEDWLIYRNDEFGFELKYPKDYEVLGTGKPEQPREGREHSLGRIAVLHKENPGYQNPSLDIYTPLATDHSRNPQATSLNDYKKDYKADFFDVIIHSQEEVVINGVSALKQNYSSGEWKDDPVQGHIFYAKSEYAEDMGYRYILSNASNEIFILKGDEYFLDAVAKTFQFIQ